MSIQSYLLVSLNGLQYALDTTHVLEIFSLPELEPIVDAPRDIVGLLNLRTQVLPVMHLGVRLGVTPARCSLRDSVIVIQHEQTQIGIVVQAVHEVQPIDTKCVEAAMDFGRAALDKPQWLAGVAKQADTLVMLLDVPYLVTTVEIQPPTPEQIAGIEAMALRLNGESSQEAETDQSSGDRVIPELEAVPLASLDDTKGLGFYPRWCPQATLVDQIIFKDRAAALRQSSVDETSANLMPLAVVRLNSEYFGFELDQVREFASIQVVTPIPCCPPHIVGNMNLRGEIVTLVDVHAALNVSIPEVNGEKVMVVNVDDIVAGIPVEEVVDVLYLPPDELMSTPIAVRSQQQAFLRGTAYYRDHLLSVVDLPQLMKSDVLVVNQTD